MTARLIVASAAVLVASCASWNPPETVQVGTVVTTRCVDSVPVRPVFAADALTGDEDIHTKAKALLADGLETRAHIGTLEAELRACVARRPAGAASAP